MNELPQGWAWSTLQTACTVVRGITFPATAKEPGSTESNVCCLRTSNIQRQIEWKGVYYVSRSYVKREDQFVQQGDVLMSMANSYELVGKVAKVLHVPSPTAFGAFLSAVRPTQAVNGDYLFHFLRTEQVQNELREGSSQTTNIANISVVRLESIAIPLAPHDEQTRIANQLDTLLTRIQSCNDRFDAIPALLKRFRQTVLDAATTGQLTDDWRMDKLGQVIAEEVVAARLAVAGTRPTKASAEFFANHQPVTPLKGVLPEPWLLTHIGMVGVVSNGSTPSRKEPSYWGGAIPWVSSGEVANGVIHRTREKITEEGFNNSSVRLLPKGTVLMAMIGEGKTRGQSAILDIDACINQNIAGVVPVEGILDSKYLWFWFRREYENTRTKGNGSGPKALNCERVRELEVNLPPLAEQAEIVRRVEALFTLADRIEARITAARTHAQRLSPLVLAKAFRGELVPQDPSDEPASALLARIASSNTAVAEKISKKCL